MPSTFPCQNLSSLLKSDAGVINTTSALVGVGVMTVLGGVGVTSVAGLVPLAHDSAAQQNASQIGTAQGLARIMDGHFTDLSGLESGGFLPAFRATTGPRRFAAQAGERGTCFVVVSRSTTGKLYFTTDLIPTPEQLLPGTATGCLDDGQVLAMTQSLEDAASA